MEKELIFDFNHILKLEEDFWKLKSRISWLNGGDANTNFFHLSTLKRRRRNRISALKDGDGNWITDPVVLKSTITNYYADLYSSSHKHSSRTLYSNTFATLSNEESTLLAAPLVNQEILNALKSFKPFKAPGPNRLHSIFYQKFWPQIGNSVVAFCNNIFKNHIIPDHINQTFLCLIPKVQSPTSMTQYRPISLCNTVYKIISKIISNRLKPFLEKLIHPSQSAFVPNRRAIDNALIVQEILNYFRTSKARKHSNILLKIDFEKAFDRLEWSFIHQTLHYFNFSNNMIQLIMSCVTTVTTRVLINGEPSPPITPSRGIRQGDPLSPYLFILTMEMLSCRISNAVANNLWKPLTINHKTPPTSHLFFADDIIITSKLTTASCHCVIDQLNHFMNASGQKINFSKSKGFFQKNCQPLDKHFVLTSFNIPGGHKFGKYLGFPLIIRTLLVRIFSFY